MRRILLVLLVAGSLRNSVTQAESPPFQNVEATIVWTAERTDIQVTYLRNRTGTGSLRFESLPSRKPLAVTYLGQDGADGIGDLRLAGITSFNGMLVVNLETATGFLIKIFSFDDKERKVVQAVDTGSRWLPETLYFGEHAEPAIGVLEVQMNSQVGPVVCSETFYMFDAHDHHVKPFQGRWNKKADAGSSQESETRCTQ